MYYSCAFPFLYIYIFPPLHVNCSITIVLHVLYVRSYMENMLWAQWSSRLPSFHQSSKNKSEDFYYSIERNNINVSEPSQKK